MNITAIKIEILMTSPLYILNPRTAAQTREAGAVAKNKIVTQFIRAFEERK